MIKCQTYANQLTDIAGNCPGIELNGQSLKMVKKFYCLRDTIGTGRVRNRRCKFRDLAPFLASRGLPLEVKADCILHVYVVLC